MHPWVEIRALTLTAVEGKELLECITLLYFRYPLVELHIVQLCPSGPSLKI